MKMTNEFVNLFVYFCSLYIYMYVYEKVCSHRDGGGGLNNIRRSIGSCGGRAAAVGGFLRI